MASHDVSSPTKSPKSSPDEEYLPLYEEFQEEDAASADILPEAKATPDQVREFIGNLLVTKRNWPVEYARRAAAKWTIGSGIELRSYTPSMYLDIFGREDGWIIYREVHLVISNNHKRQQGPFRRNLFYTFLAVMLVVEVMLGSILLSDPDEGLFTTALTLWLIATGVFVAGVFLKFVSRFVTPENVVEQELRLCTTARREPGR